MVVLRVIILFCCLCLFSACVSNNINTNYVPLDDLQTHSGYEGLYTGLQWVFEKGLPLYYTGVDKERIEKIFNEENYPGSLSRGIAEYYKLPYYFLWDSYYKTQVRLMYYKTPVAYFWVDNVQKYRSNGKRAEAMRFVVDIQDTVLEYWVVHIYDIDWSLLVGHSDEEKADYCLWEGTLFIITEADNLQSGRKILAQQSQYFKSFTLGERTLQFPEDDLQMLRLLRAWVHPESFQDSDLSDYIVDRKKRGLYLRKLRYIGRLER
jgi:hypothetical protein